MAGCHLSSHIISEPLLVLTFHKGDAIVLEKKRSEIFCKGKEVIQTHGVSIERFFTFCEGKSLSFRKEQDPMVEPA
jgi:hypothetical protein